MTMTSYAVYDAETGDVIHLHVEPAGLSSSPEEIIQLAGAGGSRRLEVIQVPHGSATADAMRVVGGRLLPADKGAGAGAAGGDNGLAEPDVPRRYHHDAADDKDAATS
jgi:hypothetical protein